MEGKKRKKMQFCINHHNFGLLSDIEHLPILFIFIKFRLRLRLRLGLGLGLGLVLGLGLGLGLGLVLGLSSMSEIMMVYRHLREG